MGNARSTRDRSRPARPEGPLHRRLRTRRALAVASLIAIAIGLAVGLRTWRSWTGDGSPTTARTGSVAFEERAAADALYGTLCESCHGREGRGDGPAAGLCRVPPADFTRAEFKVRSTASGTLPRNQDLRDAIRRGAGGDGAMPSFTMLEPSEVDRLVARIKAFSPRWQRDPNPAEIVLPRRREADVVRGAEVYRDWGCPACHGPAGAGDGPRAPELRTARGAPDIPTDLRHPWTFKGGAEEPDLARAVLTGFNGTTMPGLQVPAGAEDRLWDLAAYLRSLQQPRPEGDAVVDTATLQGYWRTPVPRQRGDIAAVTCAGCHPAQFRDWSGARHARAMSPGVWAQMNDQPHMSGNCLSCHAPLDEQRSDDYLMADGVSCSVCHARGGQRFGPPLRPTTLAPLVANFPAPHGPAAVRDFFESSDFCGTCHQFEEGEAPTVNGKFLENTVEEWRTSRAAREGKTCQTCHMPDRRHLFRGVHDPETVRAGVRWSVDARLTGTRVDTRMTLTNTETGHAFPTYTVPEVWMRLELLDRSGRATLLASKLIGRSVVNEGGLWRELADTRLLQDETATLTYQGIVTAEAVAIVGSVLVRPDAYHVRSLATHLRDSRSEKSRRNYEQALAEFRQSDYELFREVRELSR